MNKIRETIKTYFSNKQKAKVIGTLALTMIFLGVILSQVISFASLEPIRSVEIPSTTLSYETKEEGSWNITKSAKWISKGKARVTLELDTTIKAKNKYTDVILVLDTSGSMLGERLDKVKTDTTNLINEIIPKDSNVSLITFSTSSKILTEFTNDSESLINYINNLEAVGNTNYYQALVNVDTILKNYIWQENRDCVVLFLTDGYPNVGSPNEKGQYEYLKSKYPNLIVNGIQYEMGEEILEPLEKISDNQYIAYVENLDKFLYKAAVSPVEYKMFEITDYIESDYFYIENIESITSSTGKYILEDDKVVWNLNNIKSGSIHTMTIDINLKEDLIGVGEIYSTNEKLSVTYEIGSKQVTEKSTLTPIISDTYKIIYEENKPDDCEVSNMPETTKVSVFDTVKITDEKPSCDGYKFKEWKIVTTNIEKINEKSFIMPEEDVTLRATWSKLSSNKSMDGKVSVVQSLYQMMADNSVPDTMISTPGIYQAVKLEGENTPIYYYRGDVENNNVIFANFCWKIVRTTETKGVKLIYNGIPNEDGSCTATGTQTQIGTSLYNDGTVGGSPASTGYMYGTPHSLTTKNTSLTGIGKKEEYKKTNMNTTNYIYSSTVTYDSETGLYTLVDGENRVWSDTYSVDTGNLFLYTCFSETEGKCSTVNYMMDTSSSATTYYTSFSNGDTAEQIQNKDILYGNDVIYDSETGIYTLQNIITSKIKDWNNDFEKIAGVEEPGYHYTCLNDKNNCSTVFYIPKMFLGSERSLGSISYLEINSGKKIEQIMDEMTIAPEYLNESTIKKYIDSWYKNNLNSYTEDLEDTPFCNELTITEYAGWQKDGNATIRDIGWYTYTNLTENTPKLKCKYKTNAYTVNDLENGNGQLKYPIALLTSDEVKYAGAGIYTYGSKYYLTTGEWNWTMSPQRFQSLSYMEAMSNEGHLSNHYVQATHGVRPVISLKPETRSIDGNGTSESPYIVKTKANIKVNYNANGGNFNSETINTVEYTLRSFGKERITSGEYLIPTHEQANMELVGWYTNPECTDGNEFELSQTASEITVYAKWMDVSQARAIYTKENQTLTIVDDMQRYVEGDDFTTSNGTSKITKIYTGFEQVEHTSSTIPWASLKDTITNIVVQDEINPISTAYWFYNFKKVSTIDVSNINTSNTTNMTHTFYNAGYDASNFKIIGLNYWNTSQVTSMYNMFEGTGYNASTWDIGDVSNWETSSVINMQGLFYKAGYNAESFIIDVSKWNTTNVTNMDGTFGNTGYKTTKWSIGDISDWDTSNVTTMYNMFTNAGYNTEYTLDLSNWNVSKVTKYTNFNTGVESKITPPTWS